MTATAETVTRPDKLIRSTWIIVVSTFIAFCSFAFLYWHVIDWATPFLAPVLWLPVLGLCVIALVCASILPFRRWKKQRWASLFPLGFAIIAFGASSMVDFTWLWLRANFAWAKSRREETVRRITSGELQPNVSYNSSLIHLPRPLQNLSLGGGDIVLDGDGRSQKVLFFTFRGILDNFAGFVHTPEDSPPEDGDFAGEFFIVRKMDSNWYIVSAH